MPDITIDTKLNPLHALSILVTLLVAFLVTVVFQTKKELNNSQNSIIVKRVDKVIELLDDLSDQVESGNVAVNLAPSITKRAHTSLNYIWNAFPEYNIIVTTGFDAVQNEARKIKDLLTTSPVSESAGQPVKIEDGKYVYNEPRIAEITFHIENLKNILFKTQLEINKNISL